MNKYGIKKVRRVMKNEYDEEVFVCDVCRRYVKLEKMSPDREYCCKMCSLLIYYAAKEFSYPHPYEPELDKKIRPGPITVVGTFRQFLKEVKKWNGYLSDELMKRILVEAGMTKVKLLNLCP
jgi:hypothetical protein